MATNGVEVRDRSARLVLRCECGASITASRNDLDAIRRAIGAAGEGAPLEETRFASPTEIRSFQAELDKHDKKSATGSRAAAGVSPAGAGPRY